MLRDAGHRELDLVQRLALLIEALEHAEHRRVVRVSDDLRRKLALSERAGEVVDRARVLLLLLVGRAHEEELLAGDLGEGERLTAIVPEDVEPQARRTVAEDEALVREIEAQRDVTREHRIERSQA